MRARTRARTRAREPTQKMQYALSRTHTLSRARAHTHTHPSGVSLAARRRPVCAADPERAGVGDSDIFGVTDSDMRAGVEPERVRWGRGGLQCAGDENTQIRTCQPKYIQIHTHINCLCWMLLGCFNCQWKCGERGTEREREREREWERLRKSERKRDGKGGRRRQRDRERHGATATAT